jgi:serine/threonine-protein kinase 24/25/MST4
MADRERDYEDSNEALDPELLYMKEYCIGPSSSPSSRTAF